MKTLTVYTPTYNRAHLLERAYRSLLAQTLQDFVWLVIDDGSTDGTEELILSYIKENRIEIDYRKKENGGKHTATNTAIMACESELFMFALDSDDVLKPDAVEKVIATARDHAQTSGFVFGKETTDAKPLTHYADGLSGALMSWRDAVTNGMFEGEALIVFRSSYAKNFSYPVIDGEKFFTEAYVYLQMTEDFYWSSESVYVAEYLSDGYSKNIVASFLENPVSYMMYNDLRCRVFPGFIKKCKYAAYYDAFALLSHRKGFITSASRPHFSLLMLPAGIAFILVLKLKNRR